MPEGVLEASITFRATVAGNPATTLDRVLTISKSKAGQTGGTGGQGPRSATGYVYYQQSYTSTTPLGTP